MEAGCIAQEVSTWRIHTANVTKDVEFIIIIEVWSHDLHAWYTEL